MNLHHRSFVYEVHIDGITFQCQIKWTKLPQKKCNCECMPQWVSYSLRNKMHDVSVITLQVGQFCHTEINHIAKQIALFDRSSEL